MTPMWDEDNFINIFINGELIESALEHYNKVR